MSIVLDGTNGITTPDVDSGPVSGTNFSYTGTLTGGTGVVNLGSGQVFKDASGNVGIGTSSPGSLLTVTKNQNTQTEISVTNSDTTNTSSRARVRALCGTVDTILTSIAGDGSYVGSSSNHALNLITNGITRAVIDSSGNLLVNSTAAQTGASGVIRSSTKSGTWGIVVHDVFANNALIAFLNTAGTQVGSIQQNGTNTQYITSSDYRLKHDTQPMTGALAKVALLKPCTYKWNADNSADEGFIAHELQEVCPSAVTGEKDAVDAEGNPQYQGIDTSFLVATLTAAIQEQQAIIESLTARVVALEQPNE